MEDLKLMTVRALRELARTHLGPGYSRLKTKAELISALARKLADDAKQKAAPATKAEKRVEPKVQMTKVEAPGQEPKPEPKKVEAAKPEPKPEPKKPESKPKKSEKDHRSEILATLRPGATLPESEALVEDEAEAVEAADEKTTVAEPEDAEKLPAAAAGDELLPQEKPVEPPPRVKSQAEIDLENENLGELPWGYQDDAVQLLARDPHTLYVYWDFAEESRRRAHEGMNGARAVLRLFDGGHLIREVDVSLESRSWYLHHVTPGRRYRAELHFVDDRGSDHRVGPSSNAMLVPSEGPSPMVDDRFITLPWEIPFHAAPELLEHAHTGGPFSDADREQLMARAEQGLHQEGLREGQPGQVEVYWEIVRGIGGSETLTEIMRSRTRFGGQWTSSRPASAWTSSRPL